MQILIYDHQHYIPVTELQMAMSMTDTIFKRKLELYSYQCKPLAFIESSSGQCIPCKSAVMFLKWFLDNSYQTHPEINSLKHDLAKFAKKIPKRKLSRSMRIELAYRQQYKCRMCQILLPPDFEVDHIQALEDGGKDIASNLQCLCVPCHKKKTRLNRLRKTALFSEEAEVQHEAYTRPFYESDKSGEKVFSKYFSQYREN
jgi:5-methylcytosine-specific restriction protein A